MKTKTFAAAAVAALITAGLVGCGKKQEAEPPQPAASAASVAVPASAPAPLAPVAPAVAASAASAPDAAASAASAPAAPAMVEKTTFIPVVKGDLLRTPTLWIQAGDHDREVTVRMSMTVANTRGLYNYSGPRKFMASILNAGNTVCDMQIDPAIDAAKSGVYKKSVECTHTLPAGQTSTYTYKQDASAMEASALSIEVVEPHKEMVEADKANASATTASAPVAKPASK